MSNYIITESRQKLKLVQDAEKDELISLFQNQDKLKVGTYIFFAYVKPNIFSHTLLRLIDKEFDKKGKPVTFYFKYITEKSKTLYKFTKDQLINLIGSSSYVKVSTDKQYIMQYVKKSKKSIPPEYGSISKEVFSPLHPSKPDSIYANNKVNDNNNENEVFVMNKSDIKPLHGKSNNLTESKKKLLALYKPRQRRSNKNAPPLEETQMVVYKPKSNSQTKNKKNNKGKMVLYKGNPQNNENQLVPHNTEIDKVSKKVKVSPNTKLWLNANIQGIDLVPVKPPKSPRKIKDAYNNYEEIGYKPEFPKKRSSKKNLLTNSRSSSKTLSNKQQLLLENGKSEHALIKRAPRDLTEKKRLNANASNTRKITPKTQTMNIINAAIGAMFGFNQVKPKSPESIVFDPVNPRNARHQVLYNREADKRLREAGEVSSKELK